MEVHRFEGYIHSGVNKLNKEKNIPLFITVVPSQSLSFMNKDFDWK